MGTSLLKEEGGKEKNFPAPSSFREKNQKSASETYLLHLLQIITIIVTSVKFATAINCIDGRTHLPVIEYLKNRFKIDCVDLITDPAPAKIIAELKNPDKLESIKQRLKISQEKHGSKHLAIVAHHDCAGNQVDKQVQIQQIQDAVKSICSWGFKGVILGLWVDENWKATEIATKQIE